MAPPITPRPASLAPKARANPVADKLREARSLIAKGWCQGWFAKDAAGDDVWSHAKSAVCWCPVGAISRATSNDYIAKRGAMAAMETTIGGIGDPLSIANWNDAPERTQADVLAAFDRAIQLAESEQ